MHFSKEQLNFAKKEIMVGVKEKSGGKRKGAGRPKSDKQSLPISVRIDYDLIEYLKNQDNQNRFINDLIRKDMNKSL